MATAFDKFSWRPTNAPGRRDPGYRTDDVFFVDANTGWAVNADGNVIKTADGGDSWAEQAHFDDAYLRSVGFADKKTGWVGTLTETLRLLHTNDGGASWQSVNLPAGAPPAICGICVVDANTVYASGTNFPDQPAAVIKTTDGGATWTDRLTSLRRFCPRGEWGWKIQMLDAQTLFVSLENMTDGAILRSDNGGVTWRRIPINDRQRNANLEGIGFLDRNRGWVGGWGDARFQGGFTSASTDSGANWDNANEVGFRLNRFRFIGNPVTVAYASGDTVYKFTDKAVPPEPTAARAVAPAGRVLESATAVPIDFTVPAGAGRLKINIWDRFGRHVHTVEEISPAAGDRIVTWDFRNMKGEGLSPGAYIVRISIDGKAQSRIVFKTE